MYELVVCWNQEGGTVSVGWQVSGVAFCISPFNFWGDVGAGVHIL